MSDCLANKTPTPYVLCPLWKSHCSIILCFSDIVTPVGNGKSVTITGCHNIR